MPDIIVCGLASSNSAQASVIHGTLQCLELPNSNPILCRLIEDIRSAGLGLSAVSETFIGI
jgi:hypothetical protein